MPSSRRFWILTVGVFIAAIAVGLAAAGVSVWAWTTEEEVHPFFAFLFPALTAWLFLALARLMVGLQGRAACDDDWRDPLQALLAAKRCTPEPAIRASWPDAEFYQSILLPPDPGTSWWLRRHRRRMALRIDLPEGHRVLVARASVIARRIAGAHS